MDDAILVESHAQRLLREWDSYPHGKTNPLTLFAYLAKRGGTSEAGAVILARELVAWDWSEAWMSWEKFLPRMGGSIRRRIVDHNWDFWGITPEYILTLYAVPVDLRAAAWLFLKSRKSTPTNA